MRLPRPARSGSRSKLLLVSSLLLLIPWVGPAVRPRAGAAAAAGCRSRALVSTARAVGHRAQRPAERAPLRRGLLGPGEPGARPARAEPRQADRRRRPDRRLGPAAGRAALRCASRPRAARSFSFRYRVGRYGTGVYALFEVEDDHVVLARSAARPTSAGSDHLQIAVVTADDEFLRFAVDAEGDGPVAAWLVLDDGVRLPDNRISGVWRTTPDGYLVELRLPRTLIGPRLSFAVVDVDDPETRTLVGQLGNGRHRDARGARHGARALARDQRDHPRPRARTLVADLGDRREPARARRRGHAAPPRLDGAGRRSLDLGPAHGAWVRPLTRRLLEEPREDFQDVEPDGYRAEGREIEKRARRPRGDALARHAGLARGRALGRAPGLGGRRGARRGAGRGDDERRSWRVRNREFEKLFAAILAVSLLGGAALFLLRLAPVLADPPPARRGRARDRPPGPRAAAPIGSVGRRRARRSRPQLRLDPGEAAPAHGLPRAGRQPPLARDPDPGRRRALLARQPAAAGRPGGGARLHRAGRRRPAPARHHPLADERGDASRARCSPRTEREAFDLAAVVRGCVEGYRLANPGPRDPAPRAGRAAARRSARRISWRSFSTSSSTTRSASRAPGTPIGVELARDGRSVRALGREPGPAPAGRDGGAPLRVDGVDPAGRRPSASRTWGSGSTSCG